MVFEVSIMHGLGKKRSSLGRWLDSHFVDNQRLTQNWLADHSGISRETISVLCSDEKKIPSGTTMKKILVALRTVDPTVKQDDFWAL